MRNPKLVFAFGILAAIGLFMTFHQYREHKAAKNLNSEGTVVAATITGGEQRNQNYLLDVEFAIEGGEVVSETLSIGSSGPIFDKCITDGQIAAETLDIVYLPSDPKGSARVAGRPGPPMSNVYGALALAVVGVVGLVVVLVRGRREE